MSDPDRREVLGALVSSFGAIGATAIAPDAADQSVTGSGIASAVQRHLAELPSNIRALPAVSGELRRLFDDGGGFIDGTVGPGRYLLTTDPVQAIAILPVRHRGSLIDLPVLIDFSGSQASELQIAAVRAGPANPFGMLQGPVSRTTDPAALQEVGLQEQYDELARSGGGVLPIPAGQFATNLVLHSRRVHVSGAGRGATRLIPRDPSQPVLRATYRDGSWDYVTIANLDIAGADGRGTGFSAGADAYVENDEFAGRTRFVNVGFRTLDIAIERRFGQIGLTLEQCTFGPAGYHLHSTANKVGQGGIMHAGILTARDCHFTGARRAVAFFDSSRMGTGGVLFDNCIMERNPGLVFYVAAFANTDTVTDFVVRDCWNELNGTAAETLIEQQRETTHYAVFSNTAMVRFEGTPLGSLKLRNSVVHTYSCPLDALSTIDKDARSSLTHHEARGFGSYAPIGLATSIAAAAQSEPPGRALTFVIPNRSALVEMPERIVRLSLLANEPIALTGNTSLASQPAAEAVLPGIGTCQKVSLKVGMDVYPQPVAIEPESWMVWLFAYRLASGTGPLFQVLGDRGISYRRRLQSPEWETLGGMAEVAPGARAISLWMRQDKDAAEILLGGYNLLTFADRQGALDFLNSGKFAIRSGRAD